jgi:hypothetical protein
MKYRMDVLLCQENLGYKMQVFCTDVSLGDYRFIIAGTKAKTW